MRRPARVVRTNTHTHLSQSRNYPPKNGLDALPRWAVCDSGCGKFAVVRMRGSSEDSLAGGRRPREPWSHGTDLGMVIQYSLSSVWLALNQTRGLIWCGSHTKEFRL
jgi:hypothetical protein